MTRGLARARAMVRLVGRRSVKPEARRLGTRLAQYGRRTPLTGLYLLRASRHAATRLVTATILTAAVLLALVEAAHAWHGQYNTAYQCDSACKYSTSQVNYDKSGSTFTIRHRAYWGGIDGGLSVDSWWREYIYDYKWIGGQFYLVNSWGTGPSYNNVSLSSGAYWISTEAVITADYLSILFGIRHKVCSPQYPGGPCN